MSYLLSKLRTKKEIDQAIRSTSEKVLVLRFGDENDAVCMQLDDIVQFDPNLIMHELLEKPASSPMDNVIALMKTQETLAKMAMIYTVDADAVPVYTKYFDITILPATVFFFNAQHMKVDFGTADHTKFIGSFKTKQNFIDLIEVIYRGAMKGKFIVTSPIDPQDIPKFDLLYKGY